MIFRGCYFYQHHPNCTESVLADLHSSTYIELEEYLKNLLSRNLQNVFLTSLRFYSYFKGLTEVWGGGWRGDNRGQGPVLMPQLQPEELHFWLYLLLKLPVVGSVQLDSLQPHGLYPARLAYPWNFAGKNTGVGCRNLLQGIFLTWGLSPHLLCLLHWQADFFYHCASWDAESRSFWQSCCRNIILDFSGGLVVKNLPADAGDIFPSLVREDPMCCGITKPLGHRLSCTSTEPL